MQNRFGLIDTDVLPIFMVIALDIVITLRFSINCSAVICSPTVLFAILREASSETYAPGPIFHNISFWSTIFAIFYLFIYKPKIPKIFTLSFIYLYEFSLLQVTVKGLTNPFIALGASCLIVCAGIWWFVCCLPLDQYLGSQTEGNTYL